MEQNSAPLIFAVDDDSDILEILRYNLTREDFRVSVAHDGQEAIERIFDIKPDLMLLDLLMPKMGGIDVARRLRADYRTKSMPIIMLTAKGEDSDVVIGLELGATDYIIKPFNLRILIARIRSALRRVHSGIEGQLLRSIRGIEIDQEKFMVSIKGVDIGLTATEFRIIELLSGRPGRVFTRGNIVSAVRGENNSVTNRSVDVHITSLRKKLGEAGSAIETVRGFGYKLKD